MWRDDNRELSRQRSAAGLRLFDIVEQARLPNTKRFPNPTASARNPRNYNLTPEELKIVKESSK
jgi:hypothetical protein